ncbi:hypothetical protein B2J93_6468 [Marssonina coronariae]|uniref:Uncharacterized protein n=1 Tax=Diplocarpon coronariae TaxID=2795749 RepID=A0A218Z5V7_9HELO|nr:hypothetical protein B2J93_6468 [Marssonina coronariae]
MAVALLARRQEGLKSARSFLKETSPGCVVEAFLTDTSLSNFEQAFQFIKSHSSFKDLKLKVAKKGTLIFTGTLGASRCNAQHVAYGAGRSSVPQQAQTLA